MMIGLIAVAIPSWAALGFDLGTAATAGLVTGYLWYVFVHYATHHWRPRRHSYLYRARLRHARHHHLSHSGNFGVTTGVWDRVFGTALEGRASTSSVAK
jgi:sterol desaturase/sphingolipid hydroxylase (fatty acid hydroxylase superfamily)